MRRMNTAPLLGILLALGFGPAAAQDAVVIYRCTDASGAVTVQNDVACPKGSRQEKRVIETATPAPVVPVAPTAPVPLVAAEAPAGPEVPAVIESPPNPDAIDVPPVPVDQRTPPPPLFACKTWNREEYFSDAATPAQRRPSIPAQSSPQAPGTATRSP